MSFGEQLVLNALRETSPAEWVLMHSLWLKDHESKQHAEIDFLVITDRAALILEVKGGVVFRESDGRWHFAKKNMSEEFVKREGPFDQARSAFYAVRNYFDEAKQLYLFHNRIWGYGVILPQCILQMNGRDPAIKPEMYLDARSFPEGLMSFVDKLTDYWEIDNIRMKEKLRIPAEQLKRKMTSDDRCRIEGLLRPALRPVQGVTVTAREAEIELIELTKEQLKAIEFHDPAQPLILQGAAGTGKTLIAMQQIHRQSLIHNRLLFVCFNRRLADHVRRELGPEKLKQRIDVLNYHQLLRTLNEKAGLSVEPIADWTRFNMEVEDHVMNALQVLQSRGTPFEPYDYLVLDEAQDLMTAPFLGSLELLLRGGWKDGSWTICIDPRQIIFHTQFDAKQFDRLRKYASLCPLNLNCRNTREVAAYAHGLSRIDGVPTRKALGPATELVWYPDKKEYAKRLRKAVNQLIEDMSSLGASSRDIAILAVTRESLPDEVMTPGFFARPAVEIGTVTARDVVQVGTLQSFKGLEAMAIVLVGLEDIENLSSRQLAYVGGSRAKSFLRIMLPDYVQASVQQRLPEILALLDCGNERVDPL